MASPISVSDYDFLEPSRDKEPLPGEEDYYDDPEQKSRAIKDKSKLWVEPPNWYKSLILIEVKTRDNLRDGCLACSDTWAIHPHQCIVEYDHPLFVMQLEKTIKQIDPESRYVSYDDYLRGREEKKIRDEWIFQESKLQTTRQKINHRTQMLLDKHCIGCFLRSQYFIEFPETQKLHYCIAPKSSRFWNYAHQQAIDDILEECSISRTAILDYEDEVQPQISKVWEILCRKGPLSCHGCRFFKESAKYHKCCDLNILKAENALKKHARKANLKINIVLAKHEVEQDKEEAKRGAKFNKLYTADWKKVEIRARYIVYDNCFGCKVNSHSKLQHSCLLDENSIGFEMGIELALTELHIEKTLQPEYNLQDVSIFSSMLHQDRNEVKKNIFLVQKTG